jgi:hypothetical protein
MSLEMSLWGMGCHMTSKGKNLVCCKNDHITVNTVEKSKKLNNYKNFLTFHKTILLAEKCFLKDLA